MESLRPLNGYSLVEVPGVEVRPGSKLYIPVNLKNANTVRGIVIATSDGDKPCPFKKGEIVMFCPAAALSTVVNNQTLLLVDNDVILGVVDEPEYQSNGHANHLVGVN